MEKDDDNSLISTRLTFEDLKQVNQYGMEYWSARDLQPSLGYSKWQRFENAIEKAIESCKQSGNDPKHHFTGAGKQIQFGKGATQMVEDYHLSRFACYLIAQNGDARKPEIANAQKYFAIQTRRQELSDAAIRDLVPQLKSFQKNLTHLFPPSFALTLNNLTQVAVAFRALLGRKIWAQILCENF